MSLHNTNRGFESELRALAFSDFHLMNIHDLLNVHRSHGGHAWYANLVYATLVTSVYSITPEWAGPSGIVAN